MHFQIRVHLPDFPSVSVPELRCLGPAHLYTVFEQLAAHICNILRCRSILDGRQPAEFGNVEIGIHFFPECESCVHGRRISRNENIAVCNHFVGVTGGKHQCTRCKRIDLPCRSFDVFVRMKFKDQRSTVRDPDGLPDELLPVFELVGLAHVGRTNEDIIPVREVVVQVLPAIVKIRNPCDADLPGLNALPYEEISVSFTRNTEEIISVAQSCGSRAWKPPREKPEPLDQLKQEVLGIGHPLLNQYHSLLKDIARHNQVGTGEDQIVVVVLPLKILNQFIRLQILPAPAYVLISQNGHFEEAGLAEEVEESVTIVRGKEMVEARQLICDLMHLCCLVHRSANEQDLFPRVRHGDWLSMRFAFRIPLES